MEYEIMCAFPLLSASDDMREWSGFITTKGQAIRISLIVPHFPSLEEVTLNFNDLNDKAQRYWSPIIEKVSQQNLSNFLEYLRTIEESVIPKKINDLNGDNDCNDVTMKFANIGLYSAVLEEVEIIGTKNVVHLSSDFQELVINHRDASERKHMLKITIPPGYPDKEPSVFADLPFPKNFIQWPKRIEAINKMFLSYLEQCCQFWDIMDDLDQQVKVIEPLQPNSSHYHRKILLEDNVILHLTFNPLHPKALPCISFSGPEKIVETFNQRLDKDCKVWDVNDPILQNLRGILECTFASASADDEVEGVNEPCPICYVYEFEGEIPDISCVCGTSYHAVCLNDLLVSGVNISKFRRTVECPNCELEICVPIRRAFPRFL